VADLENKDKTKKRRGRWKPGESGNPGGRPAVAKEIRELARQYTDVAIEALRSIALSGKNESARVAAAQALLDRGYGKPKQGLEVSGADGGPIEVSTADLVAKARALVAQVDKHTP